MIPFTPQTLGLAAEILGIFFFWAIALLSARRARATAAENVWLRQRLEDEEGEGARRSVARHLREQAVASGQMGDVVMAAHFLEAADGVNERDHLEDLVELGVGLRERVAQRANDERETHARDRAAANLAAPARPPLVITSDGVTVTIRLDRMFEIELAARALAESSARVDEDDVLERRARELFRLLNIPWDEALWQEWVAYDPEPEEEPVAGGGRGGGGGGATIFVGDPLPPECGIWECQGGHLCGLAAPPFDFVAEAKRYRAEELSHGREINLREAMSEFARRHPEAHREWVKNQTPRSNLG